MKTKQELIKEIIKVINEKIRLCKKNCVCKSRDEYGQKPCQNRVNALEDIKEEVLKIKEVLK
jgi:hypothetical protein